MAITNKTQAGTVNDLLTIENSNSGIGAISKQVKTGNGNLTSASISNNTLVIQPTDSDTTATLGVNNKAGTSIFKVNATSGQVLAGTGGTPANRNEIVYTADGSGLGPWGSLTINTWYPLNSYQANVSHELPTFGTSAGGPSVTYTIATTAMLMPYSFHSLNKSIVIDDFTIFLGGDVAGSETSTATAMVMAYDVVTTVGANAGDFSSGTQIANVTMTLVEGYARMQFFNGTITAPTIEAGSSNIKALCIMLRMGSSVADYSVNAKLGYHYL